jgi:PhzF family phenazine biosynthesis protein
MASPDGCVDQDFEGATVLTGTPFALVDAFTTGRAFSGNPAGVLLLDAFPGVEWMQGVANELQQAETAFLAPGEDGEFLLRWFTPVTEVALCGHATLASAHWLWESGVLDREAVAVFATRSGHLTAVRDGYRIVLDFPAVPATQLAPSPQLLAALAGAVPVWAGVTDHADAGERNMLAVLESEQAVRNLAPDLLQITQLPEVNDLQAAVDWAATEGYGLVGGIGEYEGAWRMAYVRGPEGIIVSLAERIG